MYSICPCLYLCPCTAGIVRYHAIIAKTSFDDSVDTYAPEVYKKAGDLLHEMMEDGTYIEEEKPVYYIYELISVYLSSI